VARCVRPRIVSAMTLDVTDSTFDAEVMQRSHQTPVVVDLWAPWCGPCRTLGPIIEQAIDATDGEVVLAKVNVDENPQVAAAFRVQGIPAVYAVKDGAVVDGFVGAQGQAVVEEFVARLRPTQEETEVHRLLAAGDEASLRAALALDPDHEDVILALGELLATTGRGDEALELLARIPETPTTRRVAALARSGGEAPTDADVEATLTALLERVKDDDAARQEYLDLLELLGPDDPRTAGFRKALTARLF
jgi:putative thioredoxin